MGIWQIIWIAVMALSLGSNLASHGKTEVKTYNFFTTLIAFGINFAILWFGGFFK